MFIAQAMCRLTHVTIAALCCSCSLLCISNSGWATDKEAGRSVSVNGNEETGWRELSPIQFSCECIYSLITHNKTPLYSNPRLNLSSELRPSWNNIQDTFIGSAPDTTITYLLILWNPKVHYRTHKRPPPVPILGQPNPVHIPTSHFLEIHPNIIHPSTLRSPQFSLSLQFPHQDPIRPPLLTHTRHMPSPSHLDFITRTILGEQYRSFSSSLCSLLHSPITSSLLGPNILLNTIQQQIQQYFEKIITRNSELCLFFPTDNLFPTIVPCFPSSHKTWHIARHAAVPVECETPLISSSFVLVRTNFLVHSRTAGAAIWEQSVCVSRLLLTFHHSITFTLLLLPLQLTRTLLVIAFWWRITF